MSGAWLIYGVTIAALALFLLFVRSSLRDKGFQPSLPRGECEAVVGYGFGMRVTCGKKTNHHSGKYWFCGQHPPKGVV
jgi:hypothetical protein